MFIEFIADIVGVELLNKDHLEADGLSGIHTQFNKYPSSCIPQSNVKKEKSQCNAKCKSPTRFHT